MNPRVGIVGGGQLGRMLALDAARLGIECAVIDPAIDAGASVAAKQTVAEFDDLAALKELAEECDVVTFEFENVSAAALETIAAQGTLAPPTRALASSQDRLLEKQLFERLAIRTANYRTVDSAEELHSATLDLDSPAILKTRRLGYDGKGQVAIDDVATVEGAWLAVDEQPSILEQRVNFERELSVIAVRSAAGETATYPVCQNLHTDGILSKTTAPAVIDDRMAQTATEYAQRLLDEFEYVGVLALELFEVDGELLANEFAPRVHNSGHWTIDAAPTSQFENHIRAVLGLPLGATTPVRPCEMFNLIGELPPLEAILAVPGASAHIYAKAARPGRKLGHVTVCAADESLLAEPASRVAALTT